MDSFLSSLDIEESLNTIQYSKQCFIIVTLFIVYLVEK